MCPDRIAQMFENLPFSKGSVGFCTAGFVIGGTGLVLFSCHHQNVKHGFAK